MNRTLTEVTENLISYHFWKKCLLNTLYYIYVALVYFLKLSLIGITFLLPAPSRSGDRAAFASMVERCNAAGVNVIVDLVINHMSGRGSSGTGVAGSSYDADSQVRQ